MISININGKRVYHNGIIHPKEFIKLYKIEKPIAKFSSRITMKTARPFTTFLAKDRKKLGFKEKDTLLIRITKKEKEAEFCAKICKWGKIHIPNKIVKLLDIKNREKIDFIIISKDKNLYTINSNKINLTQIKNNKIRFIPRKNSFVTIYCEQKTPITIPRFIEISPKLFELFFLIHGDGHYKNKLYFVSKTPELLEFVMDQFESIFNLPREEWRTRVMLRNVKKYKKAKKFWKKKLKLKESQFYSVSKSKFNTCDHGNLRIIIDKTIVATIFRFIFKEIINKLDGKNSFYALNGLLCAEGGAQIDSKGLHNISLTFNQEERLLFRNILIKTNLLKISRVERNKTYKISNWKNLYMFFKIFSSNNIIPFKYYPKRKNNALKGFLTHSFTNTALKYLSILKENDNLNVREFSRLLNMRKDSLLTTIRKEQYSKFVKIDGKGTKGNPFIISINNEGKLFLEIVNKTENLLKQHNTATMEVNNEITI